MREKEGRKEGKKGENDNLINLEILKPGIFQENFPFMEEVCM